MWTASARIYFTLYKICGPNNSTIFNMGTPEELIEIVCRAHTTNFVYVYTFQWIEITTSAAGITNSACRNLFVNRITAYEIASNATIMKLILLFLTLKREIIR
jgi:hypothetical protein